MRYSGKYLSRFSSMFVKALASNRFFYIILGIIAVQSLWYIIGFGPFINDEGKHLGKIAVYANSLSPLLGSQKPAWDHMGVVSRDGSFMFYYIMSWPYRFMRLLTNDYMAQVIALRLICTGFVLGGITLFRKALLEIGLVPKSVLQGMLFMLAIVPSFALLAGSVNYDNLVFLLFGYLVLLAVRVIKNSDLRVFDLALLAICSLFMSTIKSAALVLVFPLVLFVIVDVCRRHHRGFTELFRASYATIGLPTRIILTVALVVGLFLFIERPVSNFLRYGTPSPSCGQVLGKQRCQTYQDYVIYTKAAASKPATFQAVNPEEFSVQYWLPIMVSTASNQLEQGVASQLPKFVTFYKFLTIISLLAIVLCMRELLRSRQNVFLITVTLFYVLVLFVDEYLSYIKYGGPSAIRARYLIPVLPMIGYLIAQSFYLMFGRFKKILLTCFILLLLAMTQGASMITYALTTPPNYYWPNAISRQMDKDIQTVLNLVVY